MEPALHFVVSLHAAGCHSLHPPLALSHAEACAPLPTWKDVSLMGPGRVSRRHCGITCNLPPPSSVTLGMHGQLLRFDGRHLPAGQGVSSGLMVQTVPPYREMRGGS